MEKEFKNIEQLIKENNISRRELAKFMAIINCYQPNNKGLYSLLDQFTYRTVNNTTLSIFNKTIDALFKGMDYPTEEWEINDTTMLFNYDLVKNSIIEYCTTDIKDIGVIIDNVAFLNKMKIEDVEKGMQSYMSSYGDILKVMNAFSMYSDDYQSNIKRSNMPEVYIPIYSKAVVSKIKEMKENKQK